MAKLSRPSVQYSTRTMRKGFRALYRVGSPIPEGPSGALEDSIGHLEGRSGIRGRAVWAIADGRPGRQKTVWCMAEGRLGHRKTVWAIGDGAVPDAENSSRGPGKAGMGPEERQHAP